MWSNENPARHDRSHQRYPSDLTDAEWQLIEPLVPPARRGGNKRTVDPATGSERPHVQLEYGLPMALPAEGSAAQKHGIPLFRPLEF